MEKRTFRSDSKVVIKKIRSHIQDYYNLDDLVGDIESIKLYNDSVYSAAKRLIEGGNFLIYYNDIREFLNDLKLNNKSGKDFSDFECWEMYIHLLAREIEKIYKKGEF